MSGVNKVILVGRLGKDPETRHLESGAAVTNFSMATSEKWKDKNTGEQKEVTEWHNVVLWRGLAEVAEKYLHKGDMVYIEGKLRTRSWEKDNVTRYTTEVVGDNMTMLSNKNDSQQSSEAPGQAAPEGGKTYQNSRKEEAKESDNYLNSTEDTDDLPF